MKYSAGIGDQSIGGRGREQSYSFMDTMLIERGCGLGKGRGDGEGSDEGEGLIIQLYTSIGLYTKAIGCGYGDINAMGPEDTIGRGRL